ncbi:MAG: hypothetical protein IPK60_20935 [Sandaracinaceae bacterium]|nr:hypothetical protein [Sandaracinaceae bacterium]
MSPAAAELLFAAVLEARRRTRAGYLKSKAEGDKWASASEELAKLLPSRADELRDVDDRT